MNRLCYFFFITTLFGCIGTDLIDSNLEHLEVTNPLVSLGIGETYTFEVNYTNEVGELTSPIIFWSSSNPSIATIDNNGLVTGISLGQVTITIATGNVQETIEFNVANQTVLLAERSATLNGSGSYTANGTARLYINDNNNLILELSDDFETDFALGTFIYLANNTKGQEVKATGLDLGQVTSGGAKTFNVGQVNDSAVITTYNYIIVLCKPAGITFGFGKFN